MPLSHTSFGAFHLTFLALALGPATASAASSHARSTAPSAPKTCTKAPVEIVAGSESTKIALAKCDGSAVPASVAQLSALARPAAATKTHKLDARVAERLEVVAEHFRKEGQVPRFVLVPGNKPRTSGSMHASGRAIDFRIDGVPNEEVVAFCKTLTDTGCGFYPTAGFVHIDVRDQGVGHVAWIDISKLGDAPKYVSSWPAAGDATVHAKADAHPAAEKKTATAPAVATPAAVVAAADEPKLPPLPAAAQFAPLEATKPEAKAEEAPKEVAAADTTTAPAKEPAAKDSKDSAAADPKAAAPKTPSKKDARKARRRHHRRATEPTHPTEQNPS